MAQINFRRILSACISLQTLKLLMIVIFVIIDWDNNLTDEWCIFISNVVLKVFLILQHFNSHRVCV